MAFAEGTFPSSSGNHYFQSLSANANTVDSDQPSAFSNTTTSSSSFPSPSYTSSSGTYDAVFDFDGEEPIPIPVDLNSEFGIELHELDIFGLTIGIKPILNFIDYSLLGQQQAQADTNTRLLSQPTVGVASQSLLRSPEL
ncbi:hypothetical protein BDN70DRAFT_878919 [Pholiota conissans]|uniref:Uncharacterized protein n=1 Tax=Pholiota conissans TaxID=109636 RepID=A0A9P6D157_9AGAR|nr:hypothetical protein BDN70DRAFT_878919 [Pholiota conissans]